MSEIKRQAVLACFENKEYLQAHKMTLMRYTVKNVNFIYYTKMDGWFRCINVNPNITRMFHHSLQPFRMMAFKHYEPNCVK